MRQQRRIPHRRRHNTTNESRWSVRYFAPGRAPFTTSHNNSRMPSASEDIAQCYRPSGARRQRQCDEGCRERDVAHQERDDVVDREWNQKQRKTDHGHRRGLLFQARANPAVQRQETCYLTRWPNSGRNCLFAWVPALRRVTSCRNASGTRGLPAQDSFLAFRTCRPLYMPVFRSRWCGRRNSPESLSSA